ncbi:hypothetical protein D3C77_689500 [compost metagenome]
MAIVIVELFEVVHIHQHQGEGRPGAMAAAPGPRQGIVEVSPVCDASQAVQAGGELEMLGDHLELRHQLGIGKTVIEGSHLIPS